MILKALRWTTGPLAIVMIVGAVWLWSRPLASIDDVPRTPFVRQFSMKSIPNGQSLDDTITITASEGIYADLDWQAADHLPTQFEDRQVSDPFYWETTVAIYPRQRSLFADDESCMACFTVDSRRTPKRPASRDNKWPIWRVQTGDCAHWHSNDGYKGAPKLKVTKSPQNEFRSWTFIAAPHRAPGDYVYELRVYPTARWLTQIRGELGPPLVLKRGLLRVLSDSAAAESNPV